MKVILRPAGSMMSLLEALNKSKEFSTMEDCLNWVKEETKSYATNIVCEWYWYDDRPPVKADVFLIMGDLEKYDKQALYFAHFCEGTANEKR